MQLGLHAAELRPQCTTSLNAASNSRSKHARNPAAALVPMQLTMGWGPCSGLTVLDWGKMMVCRDSEGVRIQEQLKLPMPHLCRALAEDLCMPDLDTDGSADEEPSEEASDDDDAPVSPCAPVHGSAQARQAAASVPSTAWLHLWSCAAGRDPSSKSRDSQQSTLAFSTS